MLLLLVPVALVLFHAVMQYLQFRGQDSPKARLALADPAVVAKELDMVLPLHEWALANGFEWVGGFWFEAPFNPRTFLAAWQHRREPTRIAAYISQGGVHVDILTRYERDAVLTTTGSASAGLFPARPGAYKQVFWPCTYDELWAAHQEGDRFLRTTFGLGHVATLRPFEEDFVASVARISRFIRSLWFWPVRIWMWYATRNSRLNVPVRAQTLVPPPSAMEVDNRVASMR